MNEINMNALPPAVKGFVRLDRCERCKFSAPSPDQVPMAECRVNAPNATGVFMGMQKNGQPALITYSAWPRVNPLDWCGQFHPKIEVHQ